MKVRSTTTSASCIGERCRLCVHLTPDEELISKDIGGARAEKPAVRVKNWIRKSSSPRTQASQLYFDNQYQKSERKKSANHSGEINVLSSEPLLCIPVQAP